MSVAVEFNECLTAVCVLAVFGNSTRETWHVAGSLSGSQAGMYPLGSLRNAALPDVR